MIDTTAINLFLSKQFYFYDNFDIAAIFMYYLKLRLHFNNAIVCLIDHKVSISIKGRSIVQIRKRVQLVQFSGPVDALSTFTLANYTAVRKLTFNVVKRTTLLPIHIDFIQNLKTISHVNICFSMSTPVI